MERTTSDRILDVAQSLVIAGGYNGFSYADIAAAVGIRKASIHHHFPTKADLVAALVARYVRQAEDGLQSLRDQIRDPVDQLDAYLSYWQACVVDATQPFCVCAMLAGEMPMLPEAVASKVRRHFQNLARWLALVLQAGADGGSLRLTASAEKEAHGLMAAVHGALLSARALGDPGLFTVITDPLVARLRA